MKLINKFQLGGGVVFTPSALIPSEPSESPKSNSKDTGYMDNNLKKALAGNGLMNDVTLFSDKIQKAETEYAGLTSYEKNGIIGQRLRSVMQGSLKELNDLKINYEEFKRSAEYLKANGTEDVPVTYKNNYVVKDSKGAIKMVSFDQYSKDREKGKLDYQILSAGELLEERNTNMALANNSSLFSMINSTRSMKSVREEMFAILGKFNGKDANEIVKSGYLSPDEARALTAVTQELQSGVFRIENLEKSESNKRQMDAAMKVLFSSLDVGAKNALMSHLYQNGSTSETIAKDIQDLMTTMVVGQSTTSHSKKSNINYDASASKEAGSKGGSMKVESVGFGEQAATGNTTRVPINMITRAGSGLNLAAAVAPQDFIVGKNKERLTLDRTNLNDVGFVSQAFTPDGKKVNATHTVPIGEVYYTQIPVIEDGQGNKKLDIDGMKRREQMTKELESKGITGEYNQLSPAQKLTYKSLMDKYKVYPGQQKTETVLVCNAISYDPEDATLFDWSDRDDSEWYRKATPEQDQILKDTVSKDAKGRSWGEDSKWEHLIFIPTKGADAARAFDGNQLKVNRDDVMLQEYVTNKGTASQINDNSLPLQTDTSFDSLNKI